MTKLQVTHNSTDVTSKLWNKRLDIDLAQESSSASIFLDLTDGGSLPQKGDRFVVTIPNGKLIALRAKSVSKVMERYGSPTDPRWIHQALCVDPLTYLDEEKLPDHVPYINTTTGGLFADLLAAMDSTLVLSLATGNAVAAVNLTDFSTFGDLLRSEIMAGGYTLRMGDGWHVQGAFDTAFTANSDFVIDQNDSRYTPTRFEIEPADRTFDSVTVSPSKEIPLFRGAEYTQFDGRATSAITLENKVFGMNEAEALHLTGGLDTTDEKLYQITGTVDTNGDGIELDGTLVVLEARPLVFPYKSDWSGVMNGTFQYGFQDGAGGWLASISSSDFSFHADSGDDHYTYDIFTTGHGTTVDFWVRELHENFTVDIDTVIATVTAFDEEAGTISLSAAWSPDNNYIRVMNGASSTEERGRVRILRWNGPRTVLTVDAMPAEIAIGDNVTRGLDADSLVKVFLAKSVTVTATTRYGLPTLSGSGNRLKSFTIQKAPQVEGYLISEFNSMPGQVYPRAIRMDVDLTDNDDAALAGSGSGTSITFKQDYATDKCVETAFNYVVGGKQDFKSTCGSTGSHVTVPIDNEQDPDKLQQTADRICALGILNYPRVTADMESTEISGLPLPFDPLPLDLPTDYQVTVPNVPIQSVKISYRGSRNGAETVDDDVLRYDITAGALTAEERGRREALRGSPVTKYPLTQVTIGGARITGVSWDGETLSASVAGGSTIYGPRGQVVDLSGCDPAVEAGVADKYRKPVTLRCTTDGGNLRRDVLKFTVVYAPKAVDAASVRYRWDNASRELEFNWQPAPGALKYNIYKMKTATGATGDVELVATTVAPGHSWSGVVPAVASGAVIGAKDRMIWVESEGLCGKRSEKTLLTARLLPLAAPTTFQLIRPMNQNGRLKVLLSAPPQGTDGGRAQYLRFFARRSSGTDYTSRSDFQANLDDVVIFNEPIHSDSAPAHYTFWYEDFKQGDEVWVACCWVDQFGDEGTFKSGFDAMHPPFEVGSISTSTFFRSPDAGSPSTNQANGGTYYDDDDTTNKIDMSGVYRVNFGPHTQRFKLVFERSSKTTDNTVGAWPTDGAARFHTTEVDLTDQDLINGYADVLAYRDFVWARKKHFTYRPCRIVFVGIGAHEVTGLTGEVSYQRDRRFLEGYNGNPAGQPITPYEVDGYFDKTQFQFKPWLSGVSNSFFQVQNVVARQKPAKIKERWDQLDDAALWRYIVFISDTPFGTKGPGTDSTIATALDAILKPTSEGGSAGQGTITLYRTDNATKNVAAYAINVDSVSEFDWEIGTTYGTLTLTPSNNYYVGVLAQNKAGRYSDLISTPGAGQPGSGQTGNTAVPSGITPPLIKAIKLNAMKVDLTMPTTNNLNLQYATLYLGNGEHSNATLWLNPSDFKSTVNQEIKAGIRITPTGSATIPADRATLLQLFSNRLLYAYATWTNELGTSLFSASLGAVDIGNFDPNLVQDSGPASAVVNLQLTWSNRKGFLTTFDRPTTNILSLKGFWIAYSGTTHWMNPVTGQIASPDSSSGAQRFISNTKDTTGLKLSDLHSSFVSEGVVVQVTPVNIVNGVETLGAPSLSDRIFPTDPDLVPKDTAIPAQPAAPTVRVTQKGVKVIVTPPSSQFNQFVKCEIVARVKNAGGTILGYLIDGTPPTAQAGEYKNDQGPNLNALFHWTQAQVIGVTSPVNLAAAATIEFYAYITNGFGISTTGLATPFNVNSWAAEAVQQDSGPPGTPVITHAAIKNGRTMIVRFTTSTSNMNTHAKSVLVIHDNNATGTGLKFFDPVTLTWVAQYSDGTTEINLGKGSVPAMNTPLASLQAGFGGAAISTIYIRIGVYNTYNGSSSTYTASAGTSILLSSAGVEPADGDSSEPTAPAVDYSAESNAITVNLGFPASQAKTQLEAQICFSQFTSVGSAVAPTSSQTVDPVQGTNGVAKIRQGPLTTTVRIPFKPSAALPPYWIIYARLRNRFTTKWSTWTRSDLGTQSSLGIFIRPINDGLPTTGAAAPTLPQPSDGINGWQFWTGSGSGLRQRTPFYAQYDSTENRYFLDIYLGNDANAYSIGIVQIEVKRRGGSGPLKDSLTYPAVGANQWLRIGLPVYTTYQPVIRVRYQNDFLYDSNNGWSAWSYYADLFTDASSPSGDITPHADVSPTAPPDPGIG